jgi:hypothetical protein
MSVALREGRKPNGEKYRCYMTFDVYHDDKRIGMVQCQGPCYGPSVGPGHRHGPWIVYRGSDGNSATNLPGRYPSYDDAVIALLEVLGLR